MAITTLEGKKKSWLLIVVGLLAGFGVLTGALQQVGFYRSDSAHENRETGTQAKLTAVQSDLQSSLQQQAYMRGQLSSISMMIGKLGEKSSDPSLKQIADTIARMAQPPTQDLLRNEVVALIQEIKAFRDQRAEIEAASNLVGHGEQETARLFRERFSDRLLTLSNELPQGLSRERDQIRRAAQTGFGGGAGSLDNLVISTLASVSASL